MSDSPPDAHGGRPFTTQKAGGVSGGRPDAQGREPVESYDMDRCPHCGQWVSISQHECEGSVRAWEELQRWRETGERPASWGSGEPVEPVSDDF